MRLEVHVQSIDDIEAAREAAEATMIEGDTLDIIVDVPTATRPAVQERKPAGVKI